MISKNDSISMKGFARPVIRTTNGIFYSGMTLHDAKMIGRDKCTLRRDFSDLDKNGDLILSNSEIIQERKREAKRSVVEGAVMSVFALDDFFRLRKGFSLWNVGFGLLFSFFAVEAFSRSKKIKESNEYIKQNFNIQT